MGPKPATELDIIILDILLIIGLLVFVLYFSNTTVVSICINQQIRESCITTLRRMLKGFLDKKYKF